MDDRVGATLRRARERQGLGYPEVEAAIKIRARFLRAIEEEDWAALPTGYWRGFVRTYATFLGLDGRRLADEQASRLDRAGRGTGPQVEPAPARVAAPRGQRRLPQGVLTGLVVLCLVAVAVVVGVSTGGGGGGSTPVPGPTTGTAGSAIDGSGSGVSSGPSGPKTRTAAVALRLATKAEVWVCVLDSHGRPLVDGEVLPGGRVEGPFHSGSFSVAFGNGEVEMQVDGKETEVPASASPLGYAIDSHGHRKALGESERPTCL